jgi:hypothetical protein
VEVGVVRKGISNPTPWSHIYIRVAPIAKKMIAKPPMSKGPITLRLRPRLLL